MNILLVDDHFCAREGVARLLEQIFPQVQVFEAESVDDGLAIARNTPLNLVLLDIQLPGKDGMAGLKALKAAFPSLCVVMFSGLHDGALVSEALQLGAAGYIVKTVSRQVFWEALRDVLSGKVYLPDDKWGSPLLDKPWLTGETGLRAVSDPASLGLTRREFEVLGWVALGKSNKVIARELGIEEQTVRNHLRPIFQKFRVVRRAELVVKVYQLGIVFGRPDVGNG